MQHIHYDLVFPRSNFTIEQLIGKHSHADPEAPSGVTNHLLPEDDTEGESLKIS